MDEIEIAVEPEPENPLELVADIMARLLCSTSKGTDAYSDGTSVIAVVDGIVEVKMTVVSITGILDTADTEDD